jgi:hypothetical protein
MVEEEETLLPVEEWRDEMIVLRIEKLLFIDTGIVR